MRSPIDHTGQDAQRVHRERYARGPARTLEGGRSRREVAALKQCAIYFE